MTQRSFRGLLVLAALLASILYLWKPWDTTGEPSLKLGLDLQGGLRVVLQSDTPNPTPEDLQAARRIIENRVNEFGVSEALIQTSGSDRIIVELPGLTTEEQDRAQDLIGQQAVLEFRLVTPAAANKLDAEMTDADLEPAAFTGEILQNASTVYDQLNRPTVSFQIRSQDARAFGEFTGGAVGRRMAIVLDGNVVSAPTINQRISSDGQITGQFTVDEASDLALVLRSGSLPISLRTEGVTAVGPTLGRDAVNAGVRAALIGGAAVVVLVLAYYGPIFGGILVLGLLYVMLLNLGILAGLGATLTLPGLAGLILTIGAAADGNIISFERIREELRAGKSLRLAMKAGFSHSIPAIIDTHMAILLAAAALYQYTSGPVRGFAITLAIGAVASVFMNSVMVPFVLNTVFLRSRRPLLPRGFHAEGFRFVDKAPVIMSVSLVLALASVGFVLVRGLNLSTDFTGGSDILLSVPEETSVSSVRSAIDGLGVAGLEGGSATVQEVRDTTIDGKEMSVRIGLGESGEGDTFAPNLAEAVNGEVLQNNFVGPSVGEDLRRGAVLAAVVSILLILAYVVWRFWPNWIVAVASIISTVHDVGIALGVLALVGAEFSIPVLSAILFVIGYSLNDSIIISDRIRENLRYSKGMSYRELVDASVNQTLSRTLMTSLTTLLPVLALFFFGGSVLRDFSLVLMVGIVFGTYSSIFILAPMVVWFKNRQRRAPVKVSRRTA
ncbi:MAG: Protein translocase subunit SecD / Protein translocase subunit SecF [uncultured Truepera sp.]|uniref:Multifunctional fusion protein n=1 Tax=uncultured Truepera sp. TaxID=543023 RepID=A0A6J4V8F0_9DEIN|nr:MAG: Protein translocase subunit SecD / Protein translocase subunit SecF [uncultured Truepera sp.]